MRDATGNAQFVRQLRGSLIIVRKHFGSQYLERDLLTEHTVSRAIHNAESTAPDDCVDQVAIGEYCARLHRKAWPRRQSRTRRRRTENLSRHAARSNRLHVRQILRRQR